MTPRPPSSSFRVALFPSFSRKSRRSPVPHPLGGSFVRKPLLRRPSLARPADRVIGFSLSVHSRLAASPRFQDASGPFLRFESSPFAVASTLRACDSASQSHGPAWAGAGAFALAAQPTGAAAEGRWPCFCRAASLRRAFADPTAARAARRVWRCRCSLRVPPLLPSPRANATVLTSGCNQTLPVRGTWRHASRRTFSSQLGISGRHTHVLKPTQRCQRRHASRQCVDFFLFLMSRASESTESSHREAADERAPPLSILPSSRRESGLFVCQKRSDRGAVCRRRSSASLECVRLANGNATRGRRAKQKEGRGKGSRFCFGELVAQRKRRLNTGGGRLVGRRGAWGNADERAQRITAGKNKVVERRGGGCRPEERRRSRRMRKKTELRIKNPKPGTMVEEGGAPLR